MLRTALRRKSWNRRPADDFLVSLLREQGWPAKDVYAAFGAYYRCLTGLLATVRAGEAARDAFLYLLAFSTLATWTITLGSLMFTTHPAG